MVTLNKVYPIGSIYLSYNSTNPGNLFGGTWQQIQGRFLLGVSSSYKLGSTGGNTSTTTNGGGSGNTGAGSGNTGGSSTSTTGNTTLTINQIPAHTHGYTDYWGELGQTSFGYRDSDTMAHIPTSHSRTSSSAGGGGSHNHSMAHTHSVGSHTHSIPSHTHTVNTLPPYIAVYIWRRTA